MTMYWVHMLDALLKYTESLDSIARFSSDETDKEISKRSNVHFDPKVNSVFTSTDPKVVFMHL